jgi:hypothetical protein
LFATPAVVNQFLIKERIAMVDKQISHNTHQQSPGSARSAFEHQPFKGGKGIGA